MHIITEAANWLWLQQKVDIRALAKHLGLSMKATHSIVQALQEQAVLNYEQGQWRIGAMPNHYFQKKGHSLLRTLTIYERPFAESRVVGVIEPQVPFLTHSQSGNWWLVCNRQGRIGYIYIDTQRLLQLES